MKHYKNIYSLRTVIVLLILAAFFTDLDASTRKKSKKKESKTEMAANRLTPEERKKYDYFFLEGVRLKEKQEYDAAFEMYEHCLSIDPGASPALYEIAQFYLYLKQPEKALTALEKAVKGAPKNSWYLQTLAAFHQSRGDFKRAIDVYEEMFSRFPQKQEPLLALVDLYKRKQKYPKVISTLDRLEEINGKDEEISMEKFRVYLMMENNKQAFSEIESLAKEYPNDMRYTIILGDVYLENGKQKEAFDIYQKVLFREPDNVMAMLSLASYYEKMGDKEAYNKQLDSILLNEKVNSDTKLQIMQRLIVQSEQTDKDSTKIKLLFDSILKQKQEDAQIYMLYAQYLILKGMQKETIPVLRKILEIDPENVPARLQLLSDALNDNNVDEVIALCEPALQYSPEILEFYFYLGLSYYQKEKKDESLETLKKGVSQVIPTSDKVLISEFYSLMGELYYNKKMSNEAYAAYDSSLVYNPHNVGTLNNYAYYLSIEKKNLDKAEEMSYKTVKAEPTNNTFLDTYAWILFEKGKYTEAKIYIDDAMKNGGEKSDVIVEHCGDIYYMNGLKNEALEYWKKAQDLGRESDVLKKKLEQKKFIAE